MPGLFGSNSKAGHHSVAINATTSCFLGTYHTDIKSLEHWFPPTLGIDSVSQKRIGVISLIDMNLIPQTAQAFPQTSNIGPCSAVQVLFGYFPCSILLVRG